MAMENPFEGKEIWFGVGSQDLYGEEALRQVAQQTGEMVDFLNATGKIPAKIVLKPTLKSSDGVKAFMTQAAAAAGHPAPQGNPVGDHRHGLHEPEPGRPRRP